MAKAFHNTVIPQTCGCGVSGIFRADTEPGLGMPLESLVNAGGAGWHLASFTNEEGKKKVCIEAYKQFREKWQIVWQSPVRTNTRTDHAFLLVMYDTSVKANKINNDAFKFPTTAMKGTT